MLLLGLVVMIAISIWGIILADKQLKELDAVRQQLLPVAAALNGCSDEQTAVPDFLLNDTFITDNLKQQIPIYVGILVLLIVHLVCFCVAAWLELTG